ncbi:hypothetical protein [Pseudomonas fluorescens group sp. PF-69]
MSQPEATFDNPPTPYSIGYRAYSKRASSPFPEESLEHSNWQLGFDDARHERHGDPE